MDLSSPTYLSGVRNVRILRPGHLHYRPFTPLPSIYKFCSVIPPDMRTLSILHDAESLALGRPSKEISAVARHHCPLLRTADSGGGRAEKRTIWPPSLASPLSSPQTTFYYFFTVSNALCHPETFLCSN